jgi:5-methylcytosine-specific restriction protein A
MEEDVFPMLERHWASIRSKLVGPFTTQTVRALVEEEAPDVWAEMVRRWGPGGRGSGNFYSPANVLYNYLNDKARNQIVVRLGFVPADKGWGTWQVMQWELAGGTVLPPTEEDIEFADGKQKFRTHLIRERAVGVRKQLLKARKAAGLSCDVCGTTGSEFDDDIRSAIFEAHHNTAPVAAGERRITINDMALLCACCHRALHRLVKARKQWFTIEQAREPLGFGRRAS